MARIEIASPASYVYATDIPIRIGDINRGRHLAHDAVMAIMEEARVRFVRSLGYPDEAIDDASFIVVDTGIIYRKQGFYGQTLRCRNRARRLQPKRLRHHLQALQRRERRRNGPR